LYASTAAARNVFLLISRSVLGGLDIDALALTGRAQIFGSSPLGAGQREDREGQDAMGARNRAARQVLPFVIRVP